MRKTLIVAPPEPRAPMTYASMLAGRGLAIGSQVACQYRLPSANQWWIHPFWIGVIEDASAEDNSGWGCKSEALACVNLVRVRIRYLAGSHCEGHLQHDDLGSLRALEFGAVTQSPSFDSTTYGKRALYEFACKCGFGDYYCDVVRIPPQSKGTHELSVAESEEYERQNPEVPENE